MQLLSYADGPISAGNAVIQRNGNVVMRLSDAAITGLHGDLFSTSGNVMVKDSQTAVPAGIHRIGAGGGVQTVFSRAEAARAIGVPGGMRHPF